MARLILIADDSPIIQRKAQRILEDEGFEVQTVSNGVAAVKKLPVMQPVLVLADVSMPGKDGYEVCEFVKTSAGLRNVPVILVGSDLEPYDEQRGTRVRADGILKKPFSPPDLIAMVRRLAALADGPEALLPSEETPVASYFAGVQAAPAEGHGASAFPIAGEGRAEENRSADVAAPIHAADDIVSSAGDSPHEQPVVATGILPEPCAAPGESSRGFVLEPASGSDSERSHDSAPGPDFAPSEMSEETEAPGRAEMAEFVLPSQLVDLTAPDDVPAHDPALAEPVAEPSPVIVPESELVPAETTQGVEEPETQQVEELSVSPQPVDLTAPEAAVEPARPINEPTPEPFPLILPEPVAAGPDKAPENQQLKSSPQPLDESLSPSEVPGYAPVAAEPVPESSPAAAPAPASAGPETGLEWGDLIGSPPALEAPAVPGEEWIHQVVQKVVARMAPPVLSPEQLEELTRLLTREIVSELEEPREQIVFPPERPLPE